MDSESAPLLPRPANASIPDSHPIYLRACHSPWKLINQHVLTGIRLILSGYLSAVFGVSLKYKLEVEDDHTKWRLPFQFSTVAFALLWAYNLQVTVWTLMHLVAPRATHVSPEDCTGHRMRNKVLSALSPSGHSDCPKRRFAFSMFYTTAHVFTFMNTIIYWAILVPAGHGGFKAPNLPHHDHGHHRHDNDTTMAIYDANKGLFEEGDIKAFSIINVWSITSAIGLAEVFFFNSIRRPTPVAGHVLGIIASSIAYLAWAGLGRLLTGHAGLFFLDPELMGTEAAPVVAGVAFAIFAPGIFSYFYGLIGMREAITATHHESH